MAKIKVVGGTGGGGTISFWREKFVAKGGPDGGNGGPGGTVIFEAVDNLNTLIDYKSKKKFKAPDGGAGSGGNSNGFRGDDLILKVPVGTLVLDENRELIVDLAKVGDTFHIAKGGRGGCGNAYFTTSTRQAPEFAETGEPGEERDLILELKLIADVAIIGVPSAGKSTLISRISAAKPKIGDYPFTTLVPNLGVVDLKQFGGSDGESFVVIDVPGLIEGASEGKGLGDEFLRHTTRARLLVHLLDANLDNIIENYDIINLELKKYSDELSKKDQIVVINKIDLIDAELVEFLISELEQKHPELKGKIIAISSVRGDNLKELVFKMWENIKKYRAEKAENDVKENEAKLAEENLEYKEYMPHLDRDDKCEVTFISQEEVINEALIKKYERPTRKERMQKTKDRRIRKNKILDGEINPEDENEEIAVVEPVNYKIIRKTFEASHPRINQIVTMTDLNNDEGLNRIYDVMKKFKMQKKLTKAGAKSGDKILIAGKTIKFRVV